MMTLVGERLLKAEQVSIEMSRRIQIVCPDVRVGHADDARALHVRRYGQDGQPRHTQERSDKNPSLHIRLLATNFRPTSSSPLREGPRPGAGFRSRHPWP